MPQLPKPPHLLSLALWQPADPEGCICVLKFSNLLPDRRDSGGSGMMPSGAVTPVCSWGSEHTSALIFQYTFLGATFVIPLLLDVLPPSPVLVILDQIEQCGTTQPQLYQCLAPVLLSWLGEEGFLLLQTHWEVFLSHNLGYVPGLCSPRVPAS